jgi:hypothetical protein
MRNDFLSREVKVMTANVGFISGAAVITRITGYSAVPNVH